jgi:hypothetical protein
MAAEASPTAARAFAPSRCSPALAANAVQSCHRSVILARDQSSCADLALAQAGSTFGVVTYTYPNVSAKVIPAFVKVVTANV